MDQSAQTEATTAEIASEYWKLIRSFSKVVETIGPESRNRVEAQVRYSTNRLYALLSQVDMNLIVYRGEIFDSYLPVVAINADEFVGDDNLIIQDTIEPTIMLGRRVIRTGKVYLTKG